MPPKKQATFGDLADILAQGIQRVATRPDVNSYVPHAKQERFHSSLAKAKLYIGGNRSGKTVGGVVEDIYWAKGEHPNRPVPPAPTRGRLVCVDYPNGFEKIVKPVLMQWIPPSLLINGSWLDSYNGRTRTITFANGSFLEIMSYDQELDAFAGASRHYTHFDEEPPSAIWTECRARLIDTGGSYWITMTPVEGMTWVYDQIYEPWKQQGAFKTGIDVIEVDMTENTYLGSAEIEDFLHGMEENEAKARKKGEFVQIGGLIFKQFDHQKHVIKPVQRVPRGWRVIASMDHGFNNPTAWLWHMVSPTNTVITFKEHYRSEWTVAQHAEIVKQIERDMGHPVFLRVGDPAIRQRNGINGLSIQLEYSRNGVQIKPGNNDVQIRLNRMINYQAQGKWYITEDCPKLLWEMRRYRWKTRESRKLQEKHGNYDEPHKKDDHACDAAGYFFVSLPQLEPTQETIDFERQKAEIQAILNGKVGFNPMVGKFDTFRPTPLPSNGIPQFATDEYMGGEW